MSTPLLSEAMHYGDVYYFSGQIGTIPETGVFAENDIAAQTAQVARNIEAALKKYGMDMGNIIKANCYLSNMKNYEKFNAVYRQYFISRPARTCVAVMELPFGALCEIEVIALKK